MLKAVATGVASGSGQWAEGRGVAVGVEWAVASGLWAEGGGRGGRGGSPRAP